MCLKLLKYCCYFWNVLCDNKTHNKLVVFGHWIQALSCWVQSAEMVPRMWEPLPLTRGSILPGGSCLRVTPLKGALCQGLHATPHHAKPRDGTPHHTTPRQANANATSNAKVTPRHAPPHHTAPQHWKDQRWIWWDILFPSVSACVCLAREQVLWWHLALTKVSLKFCILLTSPERLNDKCPFSCQCRGGFPSPS